MGGTSKKNPKAKPDKLSEFFTTTSQSSEPKKELTYPPSPIPSSKAECLELDSQEASGAGPSTEHTLQKRFHLQEDFCLMIGEFKADIQALVSPTEHIEHKMADFTWSHNLLIDSHSALEDEVARSANKVLGLEDRSRRNNIRIRGIPETVIPDSLNQFLTDLLAIILPHVSMQGLIIDHIHRIPKPRHLLPQIPRDLRGFILSMLRRNF